MLFQEEFLHCRCLAFAEVGHFVIKYSSSGSLYNILMFLKSNTSLDQ